MSLEGLANICEGCYSSRTLREIRHHGQNFGVFETTSPGQELDARLEVEADERAIEEEHESANNAKKYAQDHLTKDPKYNKFLQNCESNCHKAREALNLDTEIR